jgi:hypothetical protein
MMGTRQTGRTSYYKLEKTSATKIPRGWRKVTRGKTRRGDRRWYYNGSKEAWEWDEIPEWNDGCSVHWYYYVIRRVQRRAR